MKGCEKRLFYNPQIKLQCLCGSMNQGSDFHECFFNVIMLFCFVLFFTDLYFLPWLQWSKSISLNPWPLLTTFFPFSGNKKAKRMDWTASPLPSCSKTLAKLFRLNLAFCYRENFSWISQWLPFLSTCQGQKKGLS